MDQLQPPPNYSRRPLVWLWAVVGVLCLLAVGGLTWLQFTWGQPDSGEKPTSGRNTNTDQGVDLSLLQFSGLSLMHPTSWKTEAINESKNCRVFISPELAAYNKVMSKKALDTDAVAPYDVTICNEGLLSESLQSAAQKWIDSQGADEISVVQRDTPFSGALQYQLSVIRTFDVAFFERNGFLVRAVLEKIPYPRAEPNRAKISAILQSIESKINHITSFVDPGWKMFTAWDDSPYHYNPINPEITVFYPPELRAWQELGGIYIATADGCCIKPYINIYTSEQLFSSSVADICTATIRGKDVTINDLSITTTKIGGKDAATLSFFDRTFKRHQKIACIRATNEAMITAIGFETDSEILSKYYDEIINTIVTGNFYDVRGPLSQDGTYTYKDDHYGFVFDYLKGWKIYYNNCIDGPGCRTIYLYSLDAATTLTRRDIKAKVLAFKANKNETADEAFARVDKTYGGIFSEEELLNKKVNLVGENLIVFFQGSATNDEYRRLLHSLR